MLTNLNLNSKIYFKILVKYVYAIIKKKIF